MNTTKNLLLILSLALPCVTLLAQNTQQDTLKSYTDKYGNKVTEIAVPMEWKNVDSVVKVFAGGGFTDWVEVEQACPTRSEYTISIVQTMLKHLRLAHPKTIRFGMVIITFITPKNKQT